jgi:glycosyltransferase involved in cell wall biosynthesis
MNIQSTQLIINPLVSVIIPSYNRAETVGQTIDSILNQQCNFGFEIVIGDDVSTDNAREVLLEYQKKYPERIILLFHEQNIGLGANWATCVKHCRGKYIANCDNDDYWHNPNKLQLQVDFLENNPQYGVVHSNYRTHNRESGKIEEIIVHRFIYEKPLQHTIFNGKFKFCNATMLYRKELIDKYVNLDDYITYQFTLQDWNTWVILSKYTDFYCLPISTATVGIETESITRPKEYEKVIARLEKEKIMYKYLCDLFPADFPYIEKDYDNYIHLVLLRLAYDKLDFKTAKKHGKFLLSNGETNLKIRSSLNRFSFYFYCWLKKIRSKAS